MIAVMSTREVEGSKYDDALLAEATEAVVDAMAQCPDHLAGVDEPGAVDCL